MKYLFILFFASLTLTASSQQENSEVTTLMEQQLKIVQTDLSSQDQQHVLSDDQTTKLKKLLLTKAKKINAVRKNNLGKLKTSQSITKINEEFEPAVLEILNAEQIKAYKASPRNQVKYPKKK